MSFGDTAYSSAASSSQAKSRVQLQLNQWEQAIEDKNIDAMMDFYTNSSVVSLHSSLNTAQIQLKLYGREEICNYLVLNGDYAGTLKNGSTFVGSTVRSSKTSALLHPL